MEILIAAWSGVFALSFLGLIDEYVAGDRDVNASKRRFRFALVASVSAALIILLLLAR